MPLASRLNFEAAGYSLKRCDVKMPEAFVRAAVGGRGRLLAARAEIFCSIVHFVGAVLFLVVRAAATEATRVGRLRAVMHLVLVGLAVGACLDVLLRGALQVADFACLRRFLGVA